MNLPDAIERLRAMHEETLDRISKWDAIERAHPLRINRVMTEAFTIDAQALAVCLEALAEHAHDGGALLREVNPKAYEPNPDEGRWTLEHAKEDVWRKHSTLKSAPPLTPEERMR